MDRVGSGIIRGGAAAIQPAKGEPAVPRQVGCAGNPVLGSETMIVVDKPDIAVGGSTCPSRIGRHLPGEAPRSRGTIDEGGLVKGKGQICGPAQVELKNQKAKKKELSHEILRPTTPENR